MSGFTPSEARQRLVFHVQELERLEELKKQAADNLAARFKAAKAEGYDPTTLKVVLKLRKMTPEQRQERRSLEALYLASLNMLDGDALPESARRRFEPPPAAAKPGESGGAPLDAAADDAAATQPETPSPAGQQTLALKEPAEAHAEGVAAANAGKRVYDNPYPAGDPCRAAWDEGWCSASSSHGMETPSAYRRRSEKPAKPASDDAPAGVDEKKGAA